MGAVTYEIEVMGNNVKDKFEELREEAIYEYGNDPYNGTISTTSLGDEIELTKEIKHLFKKGNYEKLHEVLYPNKWYTQYTKEIDHYKKYSPKWVNKKESIKRKKGVTTINKFSLQSDVHLGNHEYKRYGTITEAKKDAKKLSIELGKNIEIVQHRSNGDTFLLGEMKLETDGKSFKTKRVVKSAVYLPIYKINFYVYAAE